MARIKSESEVDNSYIYWIYELLGFWLDPVNEAHKYGHDQRMISLRPTQRFLININPTYVILQKV
jgi:hypothetical protein